MMKALFLIWHRCASIKRRRPLAAALILLLIAMGLGPAELLAQTEKNGEPAGLPTLTLAFAPFYQFNGSMDGGGHMNVASYYFGVTALKRLNQELTVAIGAIYELDDYQFSGVRSIPIAKPWNQVQRYGLGLPLTYVINSQWQVVVVPMAQFSGETTARWSSSLVYGGVTSVAYRFGRGSFVGLGVGAFSNLEKISVFPFLAINWRINDRWRLSNPLQTSPAGPAGLELSYIFHKNWEVGLAGAYRVHRFRLDRRGPVPNGVGEYDRLPVVAKISYTYRPITFNLYGGVSLVNKLWIRQANGNDLYQTRHDPAPLAGANITAKF